MTSTARRPRSADHTMGAHCVKVTTLTSAAFAAVNPFFELCNASGQNSRRARGQFSLDSIDLERPHSAHDQKRAQPGYRSGSCYKARP